MSLPPSFAILNSVLWTETGEIPGQDLFIENGMISSIHKAGSRSVASEKEVWDLKGEGVLMPAGVDAQVHLRVPGQAHKETPLTGLKAALKGGYSAILTMPNTRPVIDNVEVLEQAQKEVAEASRVCGVEVYFSAALTKGQAGEEVVSAVALQQAGAKALTDDGVGVQRDEVMERLFEISQSTGLPLLQHAEFSGHGAALAEGPVQKKQGLKAYPAEAESDMVARDLRLLKKYPGARYHVLHVSSLKTLEWVEKAKKEGLLATAEVTPHHLFFNSQQIPEGNTTFKMNPPLRSPEDQKALQKALFETGLLDFVSTDHAPHEKAAKGSRFEAAAFGTTGLETTLRVLSYFIQKGPLSPQRCVEVFASKPAQFLGIYPRHGSLKEGQALRAVHWDPRAPSRLFEESELESLSKNNCFIGSSLPGRISTVFLSAGAFRF